MGEIEESEWIAFLARRRPNLGDPNIRFRAGAGMGEATGY